MSGSPILQDSRLVGAVTHVLVSDPQRGYGILAENMIRQADSCRQAQMSWSQGPQDTTPVPFFFLIRHKLPQINIQNIPKRSEN